MNKTGGKKKKKSKVIEASNMKIFNFVYKYSVFSIAYLPVLHGRSCEYMKDMTAFRSQ